MSKQQELLLTKIIDLIGDRFNIRSNYRPQWMRNPETNKNLEIDIFIPHFKLGIEFQGNQHFFPIKNMYMNPDSVRYRDEFKKEIAWKRKKVRIIEIFPQDLEIENFKELFLQRASVLSVKNQTALFETIIGYENHKKAVNGRIVKDIFFFEEVDSRYA